MESYSMYSLVAFSIKKNVRFIHVIIGIAIFFFFIAE